MNRSEAIEAGRRNTYNVLSVNYPRRLGARGARTIMPDGSDIPFSESGIEQWLHETKTVEAELTRLEPLTADIQLSTGRVVKHSPEPNGSQLATPTPGPAEMTEAEWDEYCAVLVADTRATKTVQVAELTRLEMEEK
jgi:hypothetical protein